MEDYNAVGLISSGRRADQREAGRKAINELEFAGDIRARADDFLNGFVRHQGSDQTGCRIEYPVALARGFVADLACHVGRKEVRKPCAAFSISTFLERLQHGEESIETADPCDQERNAQIFAKVGKSEAQRAVVGSLKDQIMRLDEALVNRGVKARAAGFDLYIGVEPEQSLARGLDLQAPDIGLVKEDLTVQIATRKAIGVTQGQGSHARPGEIEDRGRSEATDTDYENPRPFESLLSRAPDFGHNDLACIAFDLAG